MLLLDHLLGRPIASREDKKERLGPLAGVAVFGLDALGSAAYGPEAALTILIPLGMAGVHFISPISLAIILLLGIVCFSYMQTIPAYPGGGGSYTVATSNLGCRWGLTAGAALMIDYVLTVDVGISAGVGAMVSAFPGWQPHTLAICLAILLILTAVNLRGIRESSSFLLIPTYLFISCLVLILGMGVYKSVAAGGYPTPAVALPALQHSGEAVTLWLLVKAFSSGCTAMTGVEAVSNGVTAFREPAAKTARQTLGIIVGTLVLLLAGIAVVSNAYKIRATVPGRTGYQSVLSQLVGAVTGHGAIYYVSLTSILLVLALQANTAFAGFPRLCRIMAQDGYLPLSLVNRGRRLVPTYGILLLALLSGILLIAFGGVTDRLIPPFAVGAFLAFTLSQAGMVWHWRRTGGPQAAKSAIINGVGAAATAAALIVVTIAKFAEGAWIILVLIPVILITMTRVKRHTARAERELASMEPLAVENLCAPLVVVPIQNWTRAAQRALRFALSISPHVVALHIQTDQENNQLQQNWTKWVKEPARRRGLNQPDLIVLNSPYRFVLKPILDYVLDLEQKNPDRHLAVIVPTRVEKRWYQRFLHNQRGKLLTVMLLLKGGQRISIVNVPWYLRA